MGKHLNRAAITSGQAKNTSHYTSNFIFKEIFLLQGPPPFLALCSISPEKLPKEQRVNWVLKGLLFLLSAVASAPPCLGLCEESVAVFPGGPTNLPHPVLPHLTTLGTITSTEVPTAELSSQFSALILLGQPAAFGTWVSPESGTIVQNSSVTKEVGFKLHFWQTEQMKVTCLDG